MSEPLKYLEILKQIDIAAKAFELFLEQDLNVNKVPCPLFIKTCTGLQDNLTGVEKAVSFKSNKENFEIVHSLAKWKREAQKKYKVPTYTGIYTNMKAIKKDETIDCLHSLLVDQWDWEKVINKEDRNIEYLKTTVNTIYSIIKKTAEYLRNKHKINTPNLPNDIFFISSVELESKYPNLTPEKREQCITKSKKAVFITKIGAKLKSGTPHDSRSPDYDDWKLNGDLLVFNEIIGKTMELSSMGIRVDSISLKKQLTLAKHNGPYSPYQEKILNNELPYSIGGGIGQSRIIMFLLKKTYSRGPGFFLGRKYRKRTKKFTLS